MRFELSREISKARWPSPMRRKKMRIQDEKDEVVRYYRRNILVLFTSRNFVHSHDASCSQSAGETFLVY